MGEASAHREGEKASKREPHGGRLEEPHIKEDSPGEKLRMPGDSSEKLREELNRRPETRLEMGKPSRHNDEDHERGVSTLPKCNIYGEETNSRCAHNANYPKSNEAKVASIDVDKNRSPYEPGFGLTDPTHDSRLNKTDLGTAVLNSFKSGDNFQLNEAALNLPKTELRYQMEKAQNVINGDLGHSSIHIGVDPQNIHFHYRKTDLTVPYDVRNDLKMAPHVEDPKVREELLGRLNSGQNDKWREDIKGLTTSQLALFDAMGRSDGPALRSAMSLFKNAKDLDSNFEAISAFANSPAHGITNWGNIVWSNDLKSLTVYNGVPIFSGKFPFEAQK